MASKLNILNLQTCTFCQVKFDATKYRSGTTTKCTQCGCEQPIKPSLILPPKTEYFVVFMYNGGPRIGAANWGVLQGPFRNVSWVNKNRKLIQWQKDLTDCANVYYRNSQPGCKNYGVPMVFIKATWNLAGDEIVHLEECCLEPDIYDKPILRGFKESCRI